MDVKSALAIEMRGIEGASAADAVVERSVWKMQSTRSLTAHAEWVHNDVLYPAARSFLA